VSHRRAGVRPLAPYEPAPSPPERPHDGQLALPLGTVTALYGSGLTADGRHAHRPCDATLGQLVTALVEVAAGTRSADSLRDRLSEPLRQRLRTDPQPWLGRCFTVNRVHCGHAGEHILHVNAAVHERSRRTAFGTTCCLSRLCSGWQVSDFCLLSPALRRRAPHAA